MGVFKKNYSNIGKKASADEFMEIFKKTAQSSNEKSRALVDGALQAFYEGRPESVQTVILNADTFETGYHYSPALPILSRLFVKSDDRLADINIALAKIPEEDREKFLSNVLYSAMCCKTNEPFFSLLLQAGADANAAIGGYAGKILAAAVICNHPASVIKLLHDNGASFKDALNTMYSRGYDVDDKDTLRHYQEELEGKPAAAETTQPTAEEALPVMAEAMRQMMEQMGELTERVAELTEEVRSLKSTDASQPEKKTALRLPSSKILRR